MLTLSSLHPVHTRFPGERLRLVEVPDGAHAGRGPLHPTAGVFIIGHLIDQYRSDGKRIAEVRGEMFGDWKRRIRLVRRMEQSNRQRKRLEARRKVLAPVPGTGARICSRHRR